MDGNVLEPGKLRVAGSAFTAAPFSGDGVIVHVIFQIDASATDGETPLMLSNLRDDIQGAKTIHGKVIVSTFYPGDVNGDGMVSAGDAQLAFEFAIGKKQPTDAQIKAGDVDGNGEITAGDAQKIFFLSIGKSAKARGRALSGIFPASAQKIAVITTSGKPDEEIWLPIEIQGANNVLAYTFDLTFDATALEFKGINYANTLSAAFLLVGGNEISPGRVRVGGAAFTAPAINGDGNLVLAGFKIKSGASGAYRIALENLRDDIAGATEEAGQILAGGENTPTPTATPQSIPETTPTPTNNDLQPFVVFPLNSASEFTAIPGGFSNPPAPGGTVTIGEIPKQGGMTDGVGASIVTQPGQLGFLMFSSIDVGENTVLIRASVRSDGPGAAIALAVLDGSLDGSIATNIPSNSALFQDEYKRMVLLYDPPGSSIVPVFQVSNLQGTQAIQVNLDNYEIYLIPPEGTVPAPLLNGK